MRGAPWLAAGAVAAYLAVRHRRNLAAAPPLLQDAQGRAIEPISLTLRDGTPIEVAEAGEGPPLVLLPGLSGDKESFLYQMPILSQCFRVLAMDLRRVEADEPAGIDIFVQDVVDVLDAFGESAAAVLGLSFGGAIAMRFAARHPERARALVVVNTLTRIDFEHVGWNRTLLIPLAYLTTRYAPVRWAQRLARAWGDLEVWLFDPSEGNDRILFYQLTSAARHPFEIGTRRLATLRGMDLRDDLPGITAPTLVVRGMTDTYCPEPWSREIAALLPRADYLEIAGAGHLALISQAETFNRVVLRWLLEHGEDR